MAKILVADDEIDFEMLIKQKFRQKIREQQYEFIFAVNGNDALDMLKSYLVGKTSIVLWDSKETADFVLNLQIVEKNIGNRNGKLVVIDNKTKLSIFESKWVRGTSNAFYGYSGSRHAIGKLVKDELIDAFPAIEKKD